MHLAFSTNAYLNHSFADTTARLAGLGYRGVEVMADVPHAWPAYLLPEHKQALRDALARNNLRISNVNAFMMHAVNDPRQKYWHPSWIEPDPNYRAIRREHTKRALHLAAEIGARNLQTEPGGPLEPGQSWDAAAQIFYDEFMPCVEVAEKCGVGLLIEPEPGLMIEKFDQYLRFVERINEPAVMFRGKRQER